MTGIQRKLDALLSRAQRRLIDAGQILPIRTHEGILVGSVKIISRDAQKDLWQHDELIYSGISLNKAAIKLANILAITQHKTLQSDTLYNADQLYGNLLFECQYLRAKLQQSKQQQDRFKIDMYLARYTFARDKAEQAKKQVLALAL